jgi:predicted RNase H-like HicB family nuclease
MAELRDTVHAMIRRDEEGWYYVECEEIAVVTQGRTLDETMANLREAVDLYVEGEDLAELGLAPGFTVVVTMALEPAHA